MKRADRGMLRVTKAEEQSFVFPVEGWAKPEDLANWICSHCTAAVKSDKRMLLAAFKRCDFERLKVALFMLLIQPGAMDNAREELRQRTELAKCLREISEKKWGVGVADELRKLQQIERRLENGPRSLNHRPVRRPRDWAQSVLRTVPGLTPADRSFLLRVTAPEKGPRTRVL